MAKKNQEVENEGMGDQKEKPREVVKHMLAGYEGRAQTGFYAAFPTFGGKLPKGEALHKFEIRLPIPTSLEEVEGLYGYTPAQCLERFVKAIYTDMDGDIKKALFRGIENPIDAQYVREDEHRDAQQTADEWRYTPRTAGRKTTSVESVVRTLVLGGVLSESQAASITTADDLERALQALNG